MKDSPEVSYWEHDALLPQFDVLIIGGGLVGLSTAIHLLEKEPSLRVGLAERGVLPSGASTRNAGFACFGSMSELLSDLKHIREDELWKLVARRYRGLQKLRRMLGDDLLQYREVGGYELFGPDPADEALYARCMQHLEAWNYRMKAITGLSDTFSPGDADLSHFRFGSTRHLIRNRAEGHLHPGQMVRGLFQKAQHLGLQSYFGLEVTGIYPGVKSVSMATREGYRLIASRVLVASNGFAANLLPELAVRPARNQVLITDPLPGGLPWSGTFHYHEGYIYFRDVGNRVLLGGARHLDPEGETTAAFGSNEEIRIYLENFLKGVVLPGRSPRVAQWWSGIMGIGEQKKPLLGQWRPGVFTAVRLGGMGVALGSLVGEEAANLLLEAG